MRCYRLNLESSPGADALQIDSVNRWCQSAAWKWNSEHPAGDMETIMGYSQGLWYPTRDKSIAWSLEVSVKCLFCHYMHKWLNVSCFVGLRFGGGAEILYWELPPSTLPCKTKKLPPRWIKLTGSLGLNGGRWTHLNFTWETKATNLTTYRSTPH